MKRTFYHQADEHLIFYDQDAAAYERMHARTILPNVVMGKTMECHHGQRSRSSQRSAPRVGAAVLVSEGIDLIYVGSYLTTLCDSLAASMRGDSQPVTVKVVADKGRIGSDKAVSLGLILTELVINAIKYAFPEGRPDGRILVTYEVQDQDCKLTVSDNGVGKGSPDAADSTAGLGTAIVQAVVKQLDAVMVTSGVDGTKVAITRATFTSGFLMRLERVNYHES